MGIRKENLYLELDSERIDFKTRGSMLLKPQTKTNFSEEIVVCLFTVVS